MIRELLSAAERRFTRLVATIRTHLVTKVVSYDPETNTCAVQPVNNTMRFNDPDNMTSVPGPTLTDVPVQQFGSGKLWCTVAPTAGDYGLAHVSDREIATWMSKGGTNDLGTPRMFDRSDSIFGQGLTHLVDEGDHGMLVEPVKTDRIEFRTRSGLTEIAVLDDESMVLKNEHATVTVAADGNITVESPESVSIDVGGDIELIASGNVSTDAAETALQTGTDYAVQYTALKTAFDTLKSELNSLVTVFTSHTHPYVDTPVGAAVTSVTTTPGVAPTADMSGAKIDTVRVP